MIASAARSPRYSQGENANRCDHQVARSERLPRARTRTASRVPAVVESRQPCGCPYRTQRPEQVCDRRSCEVAFSESQSMSESRATHADVLSIELEAALVRELRRTYERTNQRRFAGQL